MAQHPVAWVPGGTLALAGMASVRRLQPTLNGFVHAEMDDNNVFVADAEQLQSHYATKQTHAHVRYWINNFQRVDDIPRGGVGDISAVKRFL